MINNSMQGKSGVVLPSVLALILCGVAIVSALVIHATRSMVLTRRSLDYQRASYLALSGLDAGTTFMKQAVYKTRNWGDFDADSVQKPEDLIPDYDGEYEVFIRYTISEVSGSGSSGTLSHDEYRIVVYSAARNTETGIFSVMTNALYVSFSHLGDYAAFYTRDLEAWPGENMTFKGKVHTNGDLYVGADALLQFVDTVTASGKFYAMRKPDSGYGNSAYVTSTGLVKFNTSNSTKNPTYVDVIKTEGATKTRMDSSLGNAWASASDDYYKGKVKTDQNVLTPPINVVDDEHSIIERAKKTTDSDYNSDTEAAKFASKAALTIRFDSQGNLHLYSGKYIEGSDANEIPNPERLMQPAVHTGTTHPTKQSDVTGQYSVPQQPCTYVDENGETQQTGPLPAYEVCNYFYDTRENKAMAFADIYVDQILNDATLRGYLYPSTSASGTGSGGNTSTTTDEREPGVLYVTYDEPLGYPTIHTEQHGTGQYQTTGTDTKTVTSEAEKNNLLNQGYTLTSTTTVTKYYYNGGEITQAQYNQYIKDPRRKTRCSTQNVTAYVLTKPIQEEIMETVAVTNYIPVEPAVRLRNASDLTIAGSDGRPGFSVITDLPMYVEGCFNTNGGKGKKDDTDDNGDIDKPAALVAADAVTMLSSNWKDEWRVPKWSDWKSKNSVRPADNLDTRVAKETTFNGILMTGIVESGNNAYSGGLQNLFRFHEHWRKNGALPYNFNGSMVCMWTSNIAKSPIETTYTYQMPSRYWGWARMNPPGLPNLTHLRELGSGRLDTPHADLPDAIRSVFPN